MESVRLLARYKRIAAFALASLAFAFRADAADCGCVKVAAQSFSDRGTCVIDEGRSKFCVLDWRRGNDGSGLDQIEGERAEQGTRAFIEFAMSGKLGRRNYFTRKDVWTPLQNYAREINTPLLYQSAASYFERSDPKGYKQEYLLPSIIALIGSTVGPSGVEPARVLFEFLSDNEKAVVGRMSGFESPEPTPHATAFGVISDLSSVGCFEIRVLSKDSTDGFDIRLAVKTAQAIKGPGCLKR